MEDCEIIGLFQDRSEDAIRAVAQKYGSYCRTIAGNILGNWQDVEECLNDTWLAAWDSIPPQQPRSLGVYLGRITRNHALNRRKLQNARKRGGGQADAVLEELSECIGTCGCEEQMDELVLRDAIDRFLRSQPEQRRRIFLRRYWAMEPVADIAKSLGLRRGQTSTILYRMRQELKEHLEKEGINL